MPTARRAAFIMVNMPRMPLFSSPTSQPTESSNAITQVGEALMPILCSMLTQRTPLASPGAPSAVSRNFGTMKRLIPLMPGGASGRRASTRCTMFDVRSWSPAEMKILLPVMA